jgi:hypothetical protein
MLAHDDVTLPEPTRTHPKNSPLTIGVLVGLMAAITGIVGWAMSADEHVRQIVASEVVRHGFDAATHADMRHRMDELEAQIRDLQKRADSRTEVELDVCQRQLKRR